MYIPNHFVPADAEASWRLIHDEPFATLVATAPEGPFVSHLPLLLDLSEGKPARLLGHMSRKNDQWRNLQRFPKALAIFHGPHAYITPRWYTGHDVPTWNYAVVQAHGTVRLMERHDELLMILGRLTARFEQGSDAWRFALPDDLREPGQLEAAIIGFELVIDRLEPKFKLGQNRIPADRAGVRQGLATRDDADSHGVLALMERLDI